MLAGLRLAKEHHADLCIVSDANTVYIDEILKVCAIATSYGSGLTLHLIQSTCQANGVHEHFHRIITNPATYDSQGALRVERLVPRGTHHGGYTVAWFSSRT